MHHGGPSRICPSTPSDPPIFPQLTCCSKRATPIRVTSNPRTGRLSYLSSVPNSPSFCFSPGLTGRLGHPGSPARMSDCPVRLSSCPGSEPLGIRKLRPAQNLEANAKLSGAAPRPLKRFVVKNPRLKTSAMKNISTIECASKALCL